MEIQKQTKYHDIGEAAKDIGSFVLGWAKNLIVPEEALELPRGGAAMLDRHLNPGEVGAVPTQPTLFEQRNRLV